MERLGLSLPGALGSRLCFLGYPGHGVGTAMNGKAPFSPQAPIPVLQTPSLRRRGSEPLVPDAPELPFEPFGTAPSCPGSPPCKDPEWPQGEGRGPARPKPLQQQDYFSGKTLGIPSG